MALRMLAPVALALMALAGCRAVGVRQYEYDERVDLSLDGSAIVDVNASIPALVALRGATLDVDPEARLDRNAILRLYQGPGSTIRQLSSFRRHGRRFVHVQIEVADIHRLSQSAPFSWSRYQLERQDQAFRFVQDVGPAAGKQVGDVGWRGDELTAFRVHLPSRIRFHNSPDDIERGNILVWEQTLKGRLAGAPLPTRGVLPGVPQPLEARMDTQSILYRTLWLFGGAFVSAIVLLAIVVWWVRRKGRSVVPA
ncbi:MAG: hypothetical protein EXQ55_02600 [Acidobacteria bacterium]|nr:hypothetical protein [Acidobacteriota bacterium]